VKLFRKLFGLDFPDPQVGQIWRSQHSGRAFVIKDVHLTDTGRYWEIDWHPEVTETLSRFINGGKDGPCPPPLCDTWYMRPGHWRRMLREERRVLAGVWPEPPPRTEDDFVEAPVVADWATSSPIGTLRVLRSKLPESPDFHFALGYLATERTRSGEVLRYQLVCVSPVADSEFAGCAACTKCRPEPPASRVIKEGESE
jgi:hypothetical protein